MKRFWHSGTFDQGQCRAMTFVEIIIAAFLTTLVALSVMSLLIITAREEKVGYVRQRVFENADRLQDRVTVLLQDASRNAGVYYADPVGSFYRRIVFRSAIGAPNHELRFIPNTKTLIYDPNMAMTGDEIALGFPNDSIAQIVDVRFRSALQTGGITDSSLILVIIEVSDKGYAMKSYRDATDSVNWITSTRSFAVNLRRL